MKKIDKVLKQLGELYELNRRLQQYKVKEKENKRKDAPQKKPTSRT